MDAAKALQERRELFDNVYQFKKNPRVPMLANFWTWKYLDAGCRLDEVLYDYGLMEKVMDEFHDRYGFDAYIDMGTRNPMRLTRALGGGFHYIEPSGEAILVQDHEVMKRDEYGELAGNIQEFYWTKIFPQYCKPGITAGELENAVKEYLALNEFGAKMVKKCNTVYGAMPVSAGFANPPFESLFNTLRGIKEAALDLRRAKGPMKETMDIMFERDVMPGLQATLKLDTSGYVAAINTGFLSHSILSVDQFGEIYWPYLKRIIDAVSAAGKQMFVFCESTMLRFTEFLQDVPKGVMLISLEQDDIFEIRKELPNIALAGGMPAALLGNATPQECIDYAKRLIDTLGNGYVFSQDKMMSFRNDAKRENLVAVNDFVRNYRY